MVRANYLCKSRRTNVHTLCMWVPHDRSTGTLITGRCQRAPSLFLLQLLHVYLNLTSVEWLTLVTWGKHTIATFIPRMNRRDFFFEWFSLASRILLFFLCVICIIFLFNNSSLSDEKACCLLTLSPWLIMHWYFHKSSICISWLPQINSIS